MPDESDVARALVATIRLALNGQTYQGTPGQGGVAASWTTNTKRGWPQPSELKDATASRTALVRVYPRPGMTRDVTRFPTDWQAIPAPTTLTVSVSGKVVTFGGSAEVGQGAAILTNRVVYPYRIVANDTPATVAAALAALIPGATTAGSAVTCPAIPQAAVGTDTVATREVARQQQGYMASIWTADPLVRDQVSSAVQACLSGLEDVGGNIRPFMTGADGTLLGPVLYEGTQSFDKAQDADVYRRDLYWRVEYPTLQAQIQPIMLFGGAILHNQTAGDFTVQAIAASF